MSDKKFLDYTFMPETRRKWCYLSTFSLVCFIITPFMLPTITSPLHRNISNEAVGWAALYLINAIGLVAGMVAIRKVRAAEDLQGGWVALIAMSLCFATMLFCLYQLYLIVLEGGN